MRFGQDTECEAKLLPKGSRLAQNAGLKELSAGIQPVRTRLARPRSAIPALARQAALQALAASNDRDARMNAADILARAGDTTGSQKLMDELAKEFPTDTMLNSVWLPVARATNQIKANQAAHAVTTLEAAMPYELGGPPNGAVYWPMYVRGEAYLRLRDGAKAAAEYQKILDHRGIDAVQSALSPGPVGIGTGLRAAGRQGQSESGLSGLLCGLERCRP